MQRWPLFCSPGGRLVVLPSGPVEKNGAGPSPAAVPSPPPALNSLDLPALGFAGHRTGQQEKNPSGLLPVVC